MHIAKHVGLAWLALAVLAAGCAPQGSSAPLQARGEPAQPAAAKRITVAIRSALPHLSRTITPGSSQQGVQAVEELVHAGLANVDDLGRVIPQLSEAVPTPENGLWKILPDGHMETTWKIRRNAEWHDGTPFTGDDIAFTVAVGRDTEIGLGRDPAYRLIESVEVPDSQTVKVIWTRPFVEADTMFTRVVRRSFVLPLPKHLLEKSYTEDKARFTELPYWNVEFVGLGPYRLQEFVRDSHLILKSNDRYVLGRPKIDEIEVRFIGDTNAMAAHILAGGIDLTMGQALSLDAALAVREQWKDGRMDVTPSSLLWLWPQFINPNPAVVGNVRFRRALLHAIDRQEMVDTILYGLSSVADGIVDPTDVDYKDAERMVVRYEYDAVKAAQLIEALGYARGSDGVFRDSTNQKLSIEIRTTPEEPQTKAMFSVTDYWKRVGLEVEPVVIPRQLTEDREYRSTFPAFAAQRGGYGAIQMSRYPSSQAPLPENRWAGSQLARYMNPEFDVLIERLLTTIPLQGRVEDLWTDHPSHDGPARASNAPFLRCGGQYGEQPTGTCCPCASGLHGGLERSPLGR